MVLIFFLQFELITYILLYFQEHYSLRIIPCTGNSHPCSLLLNDQINILNYYCWQYHSFFVVLFLGFLVFFWRVWRRINRWNVSIIQMKSYYRHQHVRCHILLLVLIVMLNKTLSDFLYDLWCQLTQNGVSSYDLQVPHICKAGCTFCQKEEKYWLG